MRFSKATTPAVKLPHTLLKLQSCDDTNVEFTFLDNAPETAARRYCNKILVHECVSVPEPLPINLEDVEFLATGDPCYEVFEVYKVAVTNDVTESSIDIVLNDEDPQLATSVLVKFTKEELCCLPLRMSYRMYGVVDGARTLLSEGTLYATPCKGADCDRELWKEVYW